MDKRLRQSGRWKIQKKRKRSAIDSSNGNKGVQVTPFSRYHLMLLSIVYS